MKYLIGLIIIVTIVNFTAIATTFGEQESTISERVLLMKDQINDFQQEIQNKAVSGVGRYYIGADGACDFSTIQQGIDATIGDANAPELLIASNKTYDENLVLDGIHMFMDGSYSNCSDARNGIHGGNRAVITGDSGSTLPIIRVQGSSFNYSIIIKNFQIRDSSNVGLQTFTSSATISLENILFFQLTGGVVRVQGAPIPKTNILIKNSILLLNSSTNGGAINCSGTNNLIALENTSLVSNSATGDGGAVYLELACDFSMTGSGLENNTAAGRGAGIYAEFGSDVELEQVIFNSNIATGDGGAIFAQDSATTISAISTKFSRNKSDASGGAITLRSGASFNIKRTEIPCLDADRCNFFDENEASNLGGAIYNNDSSINVSSTYFEDNRANFGTAIYSIGSSALNIIEGGVFNHNGNNGADGFGDAYVIRANQNAEFDVSYSTFADNNAEIATFGVTSGSGLNIQSSIIYDFSSSDVFGVDPGGLLDFQCLIVHETDSFTIISEAVTAEDPFFVDPANRDYHLDAAVSPAVDYCTNAQAVPVFKDIDFEDRGFDDVLIPNNNATNGTYDVGADEAQFSDIIFKHGFE